MVKYEKPEVFEVKATRCQRCGGILLSEFGLKNGMGHVCKKKYDCEHATIDENQIVLSDVSGNNSQEVKNG